MNFKIFTIKKKKKPEISDVLLPPQISGLSWSQPVTAIRMCKGSCGVGCPYLPHQLFTTSSHSQPPAFPHMQMALFSKPDTCWQVYCLSITNSMDMNWSKLQEIVKDREAWHAAVRGITELDRTQWLSNNHSRDRSWLLVVWGCEGRWGRWGSDS